MGERPALAFRARRNPERLHGYSIAPPRLATRAHAGNLDARGQGVLGTGRRSHREAQPLDLRSRALPGVRDLAGLERRRRAIAAARLHLFDESALLARRGTRALRRDAT